jgi:hypothetical protein
MKSLIELNSASANPIEYDDQRLPTVRFDRVEPSNIATVAINEGQTHLVPPAIEIIDIVNYDTTNLKYTIDLTNTPDGVTLAWDTAFSNYMDLDTSTNDVYIVTDIRSLADWTILKTARVSLPNNYYGVFQYRVSFEYFDETVVRVKTYLVTVEVSNVNSLSDPLEFSFANSTTQTITNSALIVDDGNTNPTWTVTITPSQTTMVNTLSTGGSGGTSNFNSSTKVLTVTGTKTQINTHLSTISYASTSLENDFTLTYVAVNNLNAESDTKIQVMKCATIQYLANPTSPVNYYNEDTQKTLTGLPLITDTSYDGTGNYVYLITPSTTSAVLSMSSSGSGGASSFIGSTKVLSITGTRSQVNERLANVTMIPGVDFRSNFTMSYTVTTPRGSSATATKTQSMLIGSFDTDIINMNVTRTYNANNINMIFSSSIPQIADTDTNPSNLYTIILTSNIGGFSLDNVSTNSTFSYTGSKASVNDIFSQIRFWPDKGIAVNNNFTYTQKKNDIQTLSQTVALVGNNVSWTKNNTVYQYATSGTWTPTYEELKYGGKIDVVVVGGGGGGGYGGGGGGRVRSSNNLTLTNTTYSFTVGAGGVGASTFVPSTGGWSYTGGSGGTSAGFGLASAGGGAGGVRQVTSGGSFIGTGGTSNIGNTGGSMATTDALSNGGYFYIIAVGGGGGGDAGRGGNGTINNSTAQGNRGDGGLGTTTFIGSCGAGGYGCYVRARYTSTGPIQVLTNDTGGNGGAAGGGGGGGYGTYGTTSSIPANGTSGAVGIRVHS